MKESGRGLLKALSQYLLGKAEEDN